MLVCTVLGLLDVELMQWHGFKKACLTPLATWVPQGCGTSTKACLLQPLHLHCMASTFDEPAMAATASPSVESLILPPCDAPIESATLELDLLAEFVAQCAGQLRSHSVLVLTCPTLPLKVEVAGHVTYLLLRLWLCTVLHCRALPLLAFCGTA